MSLGTPPLAISKHRRRYQHWLSIESVRLRCQSRNTGRGLGKSETRSAIGRLMSASTRGLLSGSFYPACHDAACMGHHGTGMGIIIGAANRPRARANKNAGLALRAPSGPSRKWWRRRARKPGRRGRFPRSRPARSESSSAPRAGRICTPGCPSRCRCWYRSRCSTAPA